MRVAFVGKGGSGKTTLSALFTRNVAALGRTVVAIDADINQHLGHALGAETAPEPLGAHLAELKDWFRGDNPRVTSAGSMVKTTPPGRGSRLLTLDSLTDPIHSTYAIRCPGGPYLMATGFFAEEDLGVACYHSKVGAVELYLNHLVDAHEEYVVVDMTAGADSFASGLFTRFDATFLVAEPTRQGVSVYRQYRDHAAEFGVPVVVIGNKIHDGDDVDFLRAEVGEDLLTCFEHSAAVRAMERGGPLAAPDLEAANVAALTLMLLHVDGRKKNWRRYGEQATELHLRNAQVWANRAVGEDLANQIDPGFVYGLRPALCPPGVLSR
ncbi:ATP-binding protein [Nonomuraea sp. NPDC050394]|uniref:ATP-binding protein n=1 Tax=Nonomuraea sp. NPDC050394 TaxID=3364363 RepID=UPI00379CCE39